MTPVYLSASDVRAAVPDDEIYDVVSQTMRALKTARVVNGPQTGFNVDVDGEPIHIGSVSGAARSMSAGVKWYTVADKNSERGLPRVPATTLITNAETGMLEGILDSTQLTWDRTAAMGIVGALACAQRPLRNVAVVGAGGVGRALVRFLATTQSLDRIAVAARSDLRAQQACDAVGSIRGSTTLFATSQIRQAVSDADLIFTATAVPRDTGLVRAAWIKENAIVCSLGSRREVDLELLSQAWIVVTSVEHITRRRADFREGGAGWNRIAGEIGSVISGELTPPREAQRIHLILLGIGVLDVALGARALANARRKGLGIMLEPVPV